MRQIMTEWRVKRRVDMKQTHICARYFTIHIMTGWMFALLLSLGATYLLAASNPLLLVMAAALPVLDVVVSKRRIKWLKEDDPALPATRMYAWSFAGFGTGIALYLITVLTVFSI
jgi:hypothetical protein